MFKNYTYAYVAGLVLVVSLLTIAKSKGLKTRTIIIIFLGLVALKYTVPLIKKTAAPKTK